MKGCANSFAQGVAKDGLERFRAQGLGLRV